MLEIKSQHLIWVGPITYHYDDLEILPSSSSFNKSYPEFHGDQDLS